MRIAARIAPAVLLAALACSRGGGGQRDGGPGAGDRVVPVAVAKVERRDVPIFLDGLGTATAYKTVIVRSQVDGRLDQVHFREGQEVRRGEVLAQIDPRPFLIQLHQAQGALARDLAQLEASRLNLKRYQGLVQRDLIARQQVDDQGALVGQYEGAVRIDRAQVETARLNLAYARITSPIDGVAGIRAVDPGNLVHVNDPNGIVTLTQLDPISVIFSLPQDELPRVSQELQSHALEVDVYSRDGMVQLGRGKLEVVDNQINVTTATLRLKAVLPNPQRLLWPNQFVKARLLLTVRRDATVAPTPAVQRGPEGMFVYVVTQDQTVTPKPVTVELQQGEESLIAGGVQAGENVVVEGQNQLRPGSRVAPHPASWQPAAPAAREGRVRR